MAEQPAVGHGHFRYRAFCRQTGRMVSGEQSGASAYAVRMALRRMELEVQSIEPVEAQRRRWPRWLRPLERFLLARLRDRRRSARSDIADAVATMLDAGLPLDQALDQLSQSTSRMAQERSMLRGLRDAVRDGVALGDACARYPGWFDVIDTAMITAGQHAGALQDVLRSLATYHQQQAAFGSRLLTAVAYPGFLLVATVAVVIFLSQHTLPELVGILEDGDLPVPMITRTVIAIGDSLLYAWWLWAAVFLAVFFGLRRLFRHLARSRRIGLWLTANPLSRVVRRSRLAGTAFTLGRLLEAGVPLTEALRLIARTSSAPSLRRFFEQAAERISHGGEFSAALTDDRQFEPEFAQLIRLGEQGGDMAAMLQRIADRYQRSSERGLAALTAAMEPVALLIMAALIGAVVMAAVLPIVRLGDLIG